MPSSSLCRHSSGQRILDLPTSLLVPLQRCSSHFNARCTHRVGVILISCAAHRLFSGVAVSPSFPRSLIQFLLLLHGLHGASSRPMAPAHCLCCCDCSLVERVELQRSPHVDLDFARYLRVPIALTRKIFCFVSIWRDIRRDIGGKSGQMPGWISSRTSGWISGRAPGEPV